MRFPTAGSGRILENCDLAVHKFGKRFKDYKGFWHGLFCKKICYIYPVRFDYV